MAGSAKNSTESHNEAGLLAAQLYIQNNLDRDLSLNTVSRVARMSASHFHRLFKSSLGETPKQYVDRLRVEKSLIDIRISGLNLLEISLRYGFRNPETYSRVFKRYFGHSPSLYLKDRAKPKKSSRPRPALGNGLRFSKSSNFSITRLDEIHLAFVRHFGKYEDVPLIAQEGENPWRELQEFANSNSSLVLPAIFIGMPHDNPELTDPSKQRFDMCMIVKEELRPAGGFGYSRIPGGVYGALTHAGPYKTLATAYKDLFNAAFGSKGFDVAPGPVFELMIDISASSIADHTWTELYIPLSKQGVSA